MAPIEKYVQSLIYEQDCVIIPDFGGILSRHIKAGYDASTGIYHPAKKKIAFNEVLKEDDGLLIHTVSIHEKIPLDKAQAAVRDFVVSLWKSLGESGSTEIEGLGKFVANKEGKLIFEPNEQLNFYPQWFGFEEIKASMLSTADSVNRAIAPPASLEEPAAIRTERKRRPVVARNSGGMKWTVAAAAAGIVFLFSFLYTNNSGQSELSSLNPFEMLKRYTKAETRALDVDKSTAVVAKPAARTEQPETSIVDNIAEEKLTTESPVVVEKKAPEVTTVKEATKTTASGKSRYFIITGAYGASKYVNIRLEELRSSGFSKAGTVMQKEKGWTMVWAASYASKEEATADLPRVRKKVGEGVWIYEDK